MLKARRLLLLGVFLMLGVEVCFGQFRRGGRRFWDSGDNGPMIETEGGQVVNEDTVRTARETAPHSFDLPAWTNTPAFEKDVFTFTRILFKSSGGPPWLGWVNDYPDGDLNFSARLQGLTSMKVDPDGRVVKLSDPALFNYPFIFMSHPEGMELPDQDIVTLRNYLLNGGALLTDDLWGDNNWQMFEEHMKRVLPGRQWTDLPMSHPLFHCVFDLHDSMQKLQVPTIHLWQRGYNPDDPESFSSAFRGQGSREMHVRAWLDDKQRIMVVSLYNTDTGDGWEREGENLEYFHLFSETRAYPLAINIVFYLMTH